MVDLREKEESRPALRLGELLVKQGYLKEKDVEKALAIQKQEQELQKYPIGRILVKIGALTEADVDKVLDQPDLRRNLGELLVREGVITREQVELCLKKKSPGKLIGQVFVEEGYLDHKALEKFLQKQIESPRFGEMALKLGLLKQGDIDTALRIHTRPRKLGEILVDLNLINPLDLNQCLFKYNKQLELGDILVSKGIINKGQLHLAQRDFMYSSETLAERLIRKQLASREDVMATLAEQYNIPYKHLKGIAFSDKDKRDLTRIVSRKYAENQFILPISLSKDTLTVGILKPEEMVKAIYELRGMYSQYDFKCILINKEKYDELFEVLYSTHLSAAKTPEGPHGFANLSNEMDFITLSIDEEFDASGPKKKILGPRDIEAEELVNFILNYGISNGASDIHIEQDRQDVKIRYRLDGILQEPSIGWLHDKVQEKITAIISRIKVMANLDITEKRLPQDGALRIHYLDKAQGKKFDLDLRIATCRATVGENITIRILDSRKANVGLEHLNLPQHVHDSLQTFLKSPGGMILVCGPTGSGKSTTLYAALQYIHHPGIKIITAEDPIEYNFPGIMQTEVNPKINLTFSKLLRSFLRLDPDVILIGEMRDEETAKIGFDAAQTGHLILSTLHTNDSISAINRLLDLGVEYGQIASSLMCVVAQRLVRRICPHCIEEYLPEESEWGLLFKKYPSYLRFYKGKGCESCNFSGYNGRILLSEIFSMDGEISRAILKGNDTHEISSIAVESGMKSMIDDGLMKLDQVTISEIIRMVPHEMIRTFRSKKQAQDSVDALVEDATGNKQDIWKKEAVKLSDRFDLHNPQAEGAVIGLIRAKYESLLKRRNGNQQPTVDPKLFTEFITTSFYEIYRQTRCRSVTFHLENNSDNGGVDIFASPNP